ncbi:MAG: hypothetical protein COB60_00140 [Flavobacteriaceae bacterium]|nr:MAG: hypothetical protein COB60_00140 [Flavobacteriaceae bacterium]
MNNLEINSLVNKPQQISVEKTAELEAILKEYPYFQAARVLHLKGLKHQQSYKYNQALKLTAAHTSDRSILFDFITTDFPQVSQKEETVIAEKSIEFEPEKPKTTVEIYEEKPSPQAAKKPVVEESPILPSKPIQGFMPAFEEIEQLSSEKNKENNSDNARFSDIIFPLSSEEITTEKTEELVQKTASALELGSPIEFSKKEEHSFSEWMNLNSFTPLSQEKPIKKTFKKITKKIDKFGLIDKFIAANPKIPRVGKSGSTQTSIIRETSTNDSLMTETLAKVYLEQEKYGSAIKAYRILSLKYPEKSSFFADRIKAIKYIQKNKS